MLQLLHIQRLSGEYDFDHAATLIDVKACCVGVETDRYHDKIDQGHDAKKNEWPHLVAALLVRIFAEKLHAVKCDAKNKQASHDDMNPNTKERLEREIAKLYNNANDLYEYLLVEGVAKECARSILPLGTPTRMYMSGSVRSWIHYIDIRAGVETQLEHRLIAQSAKEVFKNQFPNIAVALEW